MLENQRTVYVIDDDASVRDGLDSLLRSVGYKTESFASPRDFLLNSKQVGPSCLVLDVRMPDWNGLDFQEELRNAHNHIPILFLTGHGDVPMSVRAMKAGAVEFLLKPFREQDLLDAIRAALEKDSQRIQQETAMNSLQQRLGTLTAREREIIAMVSVGRLNKQIAGDLGLSEVTVKVHRAQAMKKMDAKNVADVIRIADSMGLSSNLGRQK